jgi:hypothetical protein
MYNFLNITIQIPLEVNRKAIAEVTLRTSNGTNKREKALEIVPTSWIGNGLKSGRSGMTSSKNRWPLQNSDSCDSKSTDHPPR